MTTHLIQPGPIDNIKLRCGVLLSDAADWGGSVTADSAIDHIDCLGCLRALIIEMRAKEAEGSQRMRKLMGRD